MGDLDDLDRPAPRTIVTVAVFEDDTSWTIDVLTDADPWTVEGILREAYQRQRLLNEDLRQALIYPDDEGDGDESD